MGLEMNKTCCFTGYRPQKLPFGFDERHPDCVRLKKLLRQEMVRLITEAGVTHFITGMALGIDQICAGIVLELKKDYPAVTLECAIPYEEQAVKWTVPQRERYYDMIAGSDKATQLQTAYTRDCMAKRNRYLVDGSEYVLAVWDGAGRSGTGRTVRYARELGRTITIINPATLEITREPSTEKEQE